MAEGRRESSDAVVAELELAKGWAALGEEVDAHLDVSYGLSAGLYLRAVFNEALYRTAVTLNQTVA